MNSEFKKFLSIDLTTWLNQNDFSFLPSKNQFRKLNEHGFDCIFITPTFYENEVYVDVYFGVRISLIEDSVYQYTQGLKDFASDSVSAVMSLKKANNIYPNRFKIRSENDFKEFLSTLKGFFHAEGFELLKNLKDLYFLETLYNAKPDVMSIVQFNQMHRVFRGITLAKICNQPYIESLSIEYRKQLQILGAPKVLINKYNLLTSYLLNNSLN